MANKEEKHEHDDSESGCDEETEETTEQLVAETNFLLHVLIDYLIEKEVISKAEFEDKLDAVESELFADESEVEPKENKNNK